MPDKEQEIINILQDGMFYAFAIKEDKKVR